MYFPYPDHSSPKLTPVGAYHLAESATPVTQVGSLGQVPAGYAPIRSPYFPQYTPWPYIKGPNYTRPVFRENTTGAFVARPIVRMPSLTGLGQAATSNEHRNSEMTCQCQAMGEDEQGEAQQATPASMCDPFVKTPDVYKKCLVFNTRVLQAGADKQKALEIEKQLAEANAACLGKEPFDAWAKCYYGKLEGAWYENPWYLGGAFVAGGAAIGLLMMALRKTMD